MAVPTTIDWGIVPCTRDCASWKNDLWKWLIICLLTHRNHWCMGLGVMCPGLFCSTCRSNNDDVECWFLYCCSIMVDPYSFMVAIYWVCELVMLTISSSSLLLPMALIGVVSFGCHEPTSSMAIIIFIHLFYCKSVCSISQDFWYFIKGTAERWNVFLWSSVDWSPTIPSKPTSCTVPTKRNVSVPRSCESWAEWIRIDDLLVILSTRTTFLSLTNG